VKIAVERPALARYQALPTQPSVVRDLSLVVPGAVTAGAIEGVLRREGGTLLERLEVLDEYRGAGLAAGTRGVTWRCTFRDTTRTLTEREVDALLSRMLKALEAEFDVRRRQAPS
jgi:phenylalanyl-tRNA synthetase beta chain